jgi:long-subunit fatty acid transport protein
MRSHGSSVSRSRVSLVAAGAILLFAGPAFAFGVRANNVEVAAWDTGYQGQYTVANNGPGSVSQWTVALLPTSDMISSSWDSVLVRSGQHLVFTSAA